MDDNNPFLLLKTHLPYALAKLESQMESRFFLGVGGNARSIQKFPTRSPTHATAVTIPDS